MKDLIPAVAPWLYGGLSLAVLLAFVRLLIGPTLQDRVMALDLIATLAIGFVVLYSIGVGDPVYIGIAIVVALVSFIGTIAYSNYFLHRGQP